MKTIVLNEQRYEPLARFLGAYLNQNMDLGPFWKPGENKTAQAAIAHAIRRTRLSIVDEWIAAFDSFMREQCDEDQLAYILNEYFNVGLDLRTSGVPIRRWLSELLEVAKRERSLKLS